MASANGSWITTMDDNTTSLGGLHLPNYYEINTTDSSFKTLPKVANHIETCCSSSCSYDQTSDCDSLLETFMRNNSMTLGFYQITRVSLSWLLFIISSIGNIIALWGVLTHGRGSSRIKNVSNTQMMMLNMTLADIAYTFFILPMDAVWNSTGQWLAGNALCKILIFLKYFAMYSSSGMITVMALERMTCILTQPTQDVQRKRIIVFVASAWTFALLNAIPSLVLFGVMVHPPCPINCPDHAIYQCVDFVLIPSAELRDYYIYTMLISFFIPLISIIISHSLIAIEITRMAVRDKAMMGRRKSTTTNHINKARNKSLFITILITSCFLLCWGPYYVKGLYDWFEDRHLVSGEDDGKQWMYLSMYLNPCIHPIIFAYFMESVRSQFSSVWHAITPCIKRTRDTDGSPTRNSRADNMATTSFNGHRKVGADVERSSTTGSEAKTFLLTENRKLTFRDDAD